MNLINEGFILIFTYHLYQFTDFMSDLAVREEIGKSMVVVTFANVFVNIVVIAYQSIFHLGRQAKLKWKAYRRRKAIVEQLKRKYANLKAREVKRLAQE